MSQQSLWDALPVELQEIVIENSFELCREEYLNANRKKHNKNKKKRERSFLTFSAV